MTRGMVAELLRRAGVVLPRGARVTELGTGLVRVSVPGWTGAARRRRGESVAAALRSSPAAGHAWYVQPVPPRRASRWVRVDVEQADPEDLRLLGLLASLSPAGA